MLTNIYVAYEKNFNMKKHPPVGIGLIPIPPGERETSKHNIDMVNTFIYSFIPTIRQMIYEIELSLCSNIDASPLLVSLKVAALYQQH